MPTLSDEFGLIEHSIAAQAWPPRSEKWGQAPYAIHKHFGVKLHWWPWGGANTKYLSPFARYSPFSEFLIGGFAASPFGNDILELKESIRAEMFQLIRESLSDYIDDHGLAAPMECYVVSADK